MNVNMNRISHAIQIGRSVSNHQHTFQWIRSCACALWCWAHDCGPQSATRVTMYSVIYSLSHTLLGVVCILYHIVDVQVGPITLYLFARDLMKELPS